MIIKVIITGFVLTITSFGLIYLSLVPRNDTASPNDKISSNSFKDKEQDNANSEQTLQGGGIDMNINGIIGNLVTIKIGESAIITWDAKEADQCFSKGKGLNTWSSEERPMSGKFSMTNIQVVGKSEFTLECKIKDKIQSTTISLEVVNSSSKVSQIPSSQSTLPTTKITSPDIKQPTSVIPKNDPYSYLKDDNIFIVEGDSEIISSGIVASDLGPIDITNSVKKHDLYKKFFSQHPEAKDKYDFIFIATTFKPNDDIGQFEPFKNGISGVGDARENINASNLRNYLGLTGQEKIQGAAFVMNLDSIDDELYLLLHEMSHRWLFHLGDYDSCGKGFGCTRETGYNINIEGSHYNKSVNTKTNVNGQLYRDPNGGGSMEMSSVSGYCSDNGGSLYRFTSLSLYLMGLIPSTEVEPLKYYETTGGWTEQGIACVEHTFGVNDIIGLVGQRNPSYPNTQKNFSVAYILLTQQGETPTSSELNRMQFISDNFPKRWSQATWYKSTINK